MRPVELGPSPKSNEKLWANTTLGYKKIRIKNKNTKARDRTNFLYMVPYLPEESCELPITDRLLILFG